MARRKQIKNIGFISTRIAGTDGVSLEIGKWVNVLERNRYDCFYFSGENDRPPEQCMLVEEAHFQHADIMEIHNQCFGKQTRSLEVTKRIHKVREYLKDQIYKFVKRFDIDLIIRRAARPHGEMVFRRIDRDTI